MIYDIFLFEDHSILTSNYAKVRVEIKSTIAQSFVFKDAECTFHAISQLIRSHFIKLEKIFQSKITQR